MSEGNYASEILAELRVSSTRMWRIAIAAIVGWILTAGVFVWYIYNTEEYSVEAKGVYTAVDGGKNLVTSQDVDPETWQLFLEWLDMNGENTGHDSVTP